MVVKLGKSHPPLCLRKLRGIAFSNGKFIAVTTDGYVATSTDGIIWTTPEQIKDESKVVTATLNGICAMP